MNMKWLCIAAGIALILAITPTLPYSYYIFLRWGIFFVALAVGINFYKAKSVGWVLVFATIAYLFNPFLPVYLHRSSWTPIDMISAVLFFISSNSIKTTHE